jgi:hypothetical protein
MLPLSVLLYLLRLASQLQFYPTSPSAAISSGWDGFYDPIIEWWKPEASADTAHRTSPPRRTNQTATAVIAELDGGGGIGSHADSFNGSSYSFLNYRCRLPRHSLFPDPEEAIRNEEECLRQIASQLARAWPRAPRSRWCSDANRAGIVLIKVPKSASSTMAGMALHAATAAPPLSSSSTASSSFPLSSGCLVEWEHANAAESPTLQRHERNHFANSSNNINSTIADIYVDDRRRRHFLLMAPIRSPFSRALSDVYYHKVSLGSGTRKSPQDRYVEAQLDRVPDNYILRYITTLSWESQPPPSPEQQAQTRQNDELQSPPLHATSASGGHYGFTTFQIPRFYVEHIKNAIRLYDFLVVADRLPESIVLLSNLTGTSFHDWMTLSSKMSGSYYRASPTRCVPLVPPVSTPHILGYARNTWNPRNVGDRLLYEVANACLERTIDVIGRDWVAKQVEQVKDFQRHIRRRCTNETFFPCSQSGIVQHEEALASCYIRDFGCGHACVRRESRAWNAATVVG